MSFLSRRRRWWVAALVLALLGLAHLWFWYLPRERSTEPRWSDLPARVLAGEAISLTEGEAPVRYPLALWIPYPHQNLAFAVEDLGGVETLAAGAGGLAGREVPPIPSFGPLPMPPARELVVATDREGHRVLAAARVYPAVAVLARLAGTLAGNAWLAGGRWTAGTRELAVEWRGTLWTVTTTETAVDVLTDPASVGFPRGTGDQPGAPAVGADTSGEVPATFGAPPGEPPGPLLAAFRLDRRWGSIPPGFFSLRRDPSAGSEREDLVLANRAAEPYPEGLPAERRPGYLLPQGVALATYGESPDRRRPSRALMLFEAPSAGTEGFGGAALFETEGESSGRVSGLSLGLAVLLGQDAFRGRAAGWTVNATGRTDYRRAVDLAGNLRAYRRAWRQGGPPRLSQSLALKPAPTRRAVGRLAEALAKVVPPDHPDLLRARGLESLLASFEGFGLVTLVVTEGHSSVPGDPGRPAWAELRLRQE